MAQVPNPYPNPVNDPWYLPYDTLDYSEHPDPWRLPNNLTTDTYFSTGYSGSTAPPVFVVDDITGLPVLDDITGQPITRDP